jgi:hypothetical protein
VINVRRYSAIIVNFLWGDVSWVVAPFRVSSKLLLVILLAYLFVEKLLVGSYISIGSNDYEALRPLFKNASDELSKIKTQKFGYDHLSLCLDAKPVAPNNCSVTQFKDQETYGLGYQLLDPNGKVVVKGIVFEVQPIWNFISYARITESTDTLLRNIELAAFNGVDTAVNQIKLCTGTRSLLDGDNCAQTSRIGKILAPPESASANLDSTINRLRVGSLFTGPIQFGTFCLFLYATFETIGLWLRWVAPTDKMYQASELQLEGDERPIVVVHPRSPAESLSLLAESKVRSVGDRLYIVDLKAAGDAGDLSPPATQEEFISIHSSYRTFLQDDAVMRQEHLETLGDTMLKLAFLGTVYGISTALFSARGLDTADPIRRLLIKGDMYSSIGIGFGTTLVGILLSIVAAQFRSKLAASWSVKIGEAYQLILDFGVARMKEVARGLTPVQLIGLNPDPPSRKTHSTFEVFGVIVFTMVIVAVLFYFRFEIWAGLNYWRPR